MFGRKKKESDIFAAFALLASALDGGGNIGTIMPEDDAFDLAHGAEYIPCEVTDARREGKRVIYMPAEKSWKMPDGTIVK